MHRKYTSLFVTVIIIIIIITTIIIPGTAFMVMSSRSKSFSRVHPVHLISVYMYTTYKLPTSGSEKEQVRMTRFVVSTN